MINTVKSSADIGDSREDRRRAQPHLRREPEASAAPAAKAESGVRSDLRLMIEYDDERGSLTYKLIDRLTGEVVSVVSREDLMKMQADPSYTAGKVIDTKA